jgi:hypothetical protein
VGARRSPKNICILLTVAFLGVHGRPRGDQKRRADRSSQLENNHVVCARDARKKQVRGAMNQPPLLYSRRYYGFICSGGATRATRRIRPKPRHMRLAGWLAERGVKWGSLVRSLFRLTTERHLLRVDGADRIEAVPRCTPIVHLAVISRRPLALCFCPFLSFSESESVARRRQINVNRLGMRLRRVLQRRDHKSIPGGTGQIEMTRSI